ncbi:hypothetical protein [Aminobacterium sp. UBA4987]|uniref:hypothetical protein n=1 Tax=Aminobacterium sp. UBA4987 TaxID=1946027 RepID=UPI0025805E9F|nr:hypothetical protein [Aminobacterium sp. UBA4987]MDD2379326.1 hypothetical protein [Aminobacterium colombiense]MDD3768470.1 hypothetical protein [Aminobacterium colombiense]
MSARTGIPVDEGGGVSKIRRMPLGFRRPNPKIALQIQEVISGTKRAIGLLLPVGKAVH